jgi:hypothetical protein
VREEIARYLNSTEWIQLENGEKIKVFLNDNSLEVQIDKDQPGNIFKDDENYKDVFDTLIKIDPDHKEVYENR